MGGKEVKLENLPLDEVDFCVIDTETTGGNAVFNRVIDVAVFHVRGGEVQEKFDTLLNPGKPIPEWITGLTGINDDMVRNAPVFDDIAPDLKKILSKGVFTAHNSRFDYGFISEEFRRAGVDFERPQCCTLRLARQLLPELPSKSLGNLCEEFLIDIWDRHRAAGDAEATVYVLKEFLKLLKKNHGVATWGDIDGFQRFGRLTLPEGMTFQSIAALPARAGRYSFIDEKGEVVFRGGAKDIRSRIHNLFRASNRTPRANKLRSVVRRIEVEADGRPSRLEAGKKAAV